MNQAIIIIVVIITLVYLLYKSNCFEKMLPPWELQNCQLQCQREGAVPAWNSPQGAWDDPANLPSSTFDVAGCIEKCNLNTWYGGEY